MRKHFICITCDLWPPVFWNKWWWWWLRAKLAYQSLQWSETTDLTSWSPRSSSSSATEAATASSSSWRSAHNHNAMTYLTLYHIKQESWAIAKITARCALCMGALKIFGSPWLRPWLLFSKFLMVFCSDWAHKCACKIWSSYLYPFLR